MTYFDLYEIKPTFFPDLTDLKSKFLKLSRQYHPDRFISQSETEQLQAEEKSALNNKAYHTLLSPDLRLKYILELHQVIQPEEMYTLDQDFLMDMLDINDLIFDQPLTAQGLIDLKDKELDANTSDVLKAYQFDSVSSNDLQAIKEYYYKKRYLWRLRENVKGNVDL